MKKGQGNLFHPGNGRRDDRRCGTGGGGTPPAGLSEDLRTGTPLDRYQALIPVVKTHYEYLVKFEKEGTELRRAAKAFEEAYAPGTEKGVPQSMYLPWLYFDLTFGASGKTVIGDYLESRFARELAEPGPTLLRRMADSYSSFYAVKEVHPDCILFEELGTSEEWKVYRMNEPFEEEISPSDLWYVRFLGPRGGAYMFSAPYLLDPALRQDVERAVLLQADEFGKERPELGKAEAFRLACKAFLPFWAEYFVYGDGEDEFPLLYNTDGEAIRFCTLTFEILDRQKVLGRLSTVKDFEEEGAGSWTWFKKGKGGKGGLETVTLGTVRARRKYLTAETNSEERAVRLLRKLKRLLADGVSFKGMKVADPGDMPPPSPEDMKRLEEEQARLYADPEVRALLTRKAEDYYHKEWLTTPIPALRNLTPLQAVETEEGRASVAELLNHLEERQDAMPDEPFRVEVDGLRKRLGLSPRKQGKG